MAEPSAKFDDLTSDQQRFIVEWLSNNFIPTKSINKHSSAYGIKQPFSRLFFFVTQEQMTEAMIRAGFKAVEAPSGVFRFNISERSPAFQAFRAHSAE